MRGFFVRDRTAIVVGAVRQHSAKTSLLIDMLDEKLLQPGKYVSVKGACNDERFTGLEAAGGVRR